MHMLCATQRPEGALASVPLTAIDLTQPTKEDLAPDDLKLRVHVSMSTHLWYSFSSTLYVVKTTSALPKKQLTCGAHSQARCMW